MHRRGAKKDIFNADVVNKLFLHYQEFEMKGDDLLAFQEQITGVSVVSREMHKNPALSTSIINCWSSSNNMEPLPTGIDHRRAFPLYADNKYSEKSMLAVEDASDARDKKSIYMAKVGGARHGGTTRSTAEENITVAEHCYKYS